MSGYKHGKSGHPLYKVWTEMKQRCLNKNNKDYYKYGDRGIGVCFIWKNDVSGFIEWSLSHGWEKGLQIDRVDNNKDYSPGNCRFVTAKENCRNTRNNVVLKYKDFHGTISELAENIGMKAGTLYSRIIIRKWDIERAVITPVRQMIRRR